MHSIKNLFFKSRHWFRSQLIPTVQASFHDFFFVDQVPNLAASLAFFTLLSLLPLLVIVVVTFSLLMENSAQAYQFILNLTNQFAPVTVTDTIEVIISNLDANLTAGWIGTIFLIWSGSRVFTILAFTLNRVWTLQHDRGFVNKTILAMSIVPLLIILFGLSMLITSMFTFVQQIRIPWIRIAIGDIAFVWELVGSVAPLCLSFLGFFIIYKFVVAKHVDFIDAIAGALTATFLWECLKWGYEYWVVHMWMGDRLYGSLGTLVVFVLWIYLSCSTLLFGGEIAYNWGKVKKQISKPLDSSVEQKAD